MRVAIVGGGYMGGGMAQVFALHGIGSRIADVDAESALACVERVIDEAHRFEEQGLFPPGSGRAVADAVRASTSVEDAVAGADYIAEVVPESWEVKKATFARISAAATGEAVIASNTSAMPIDKLAAAVRNPERFLGVHWMNPAPFVPGVEVIPGTMTAPHVVDGAERLMRELDKVPVRVADSPGFVASRLQYALLQECCRIVAEGHATPGQVDEVVTNTFGFRLAFFGPFAIADMAGLDVYAGGFATLEAAYGARFSVPEILQRSAAEGRIGVKAGNGLTDLSQGSAEQLAAYRNAAYAALATLKADVGPIPGS